MTNLEIKQMNGINVTDSRLVAEMIGKEHSKLLRDIRNLIKRNPDVENYFIKSTYTDAQGQSRPCYLLTKEGCELLTNKYKLQAHAGRLELRFLDGLEEALKPFNINDGIRQYSINVNNKHYRIDYYIQSLNIAIEYDENGHASYSYEEHEGRQKEIENKLSCKFIRVSDENTDAYNIGLVLKNIFTIIK